MNILRSQMKTTEVSLIKRTQEMVARISYIEDIMKQMDTLAKENAKLKKNPDTKTFQKYRTLWTDQI